MNNNSFGTNSYTADMPDSYVHFNKHKVFDKLLDRFTKHNPQNNERDIPRLWSLILNCKQVLHEGVEGDFAEVGVFRGNSAAVLAEFAKFMGRRAYLFDTFDGFDETAFNGPDSQRQAGEWGDTSTSLVEEVLGDSAEACSFVGGYFPDSLTKEHKKNNYAIVSIDCDLYKPIKASLDEFYPLLSHGGVFFVHDYSSRFWEGATNAVDEFCKETGEHLIAMPDKSGSAFIRKTVKPQE